MSKLQKAIEELNEELEKAKRVPIGTVSKNYKKVAEGKWVKISDKKDNKKKVDQTETKEFKKWFGDSKVVDKNGKPSVVYHGTSKSFEKFDISKSGENYSEGKGGIFFTNRKDKAESYAKLHQEVEKSGNATVINSYLKIERPYYDIAEDYYGAVEKFDRNASELVRTLPLEGYDGVIIESPTGNLYVAFDSDQVKIIKQ